MFFKIKFSYLNESSSLSYSMAIYLGTWNIKATFSCVSYVQKFSKPVMKTRDWIHVETFTPPHVSYIF